MSYDKNGIDIAPVAIAPYIFIAIFDDVGENPYVIIGHGY